MTGRPGVLLDRDGTLIDELGYLGDPGGVRLFPGAGLAVRALNEAGLPVALLTNQSGVARGMFTESDVAAVHARVERELALDGARLDLVLYCPHHPEHGAPPYRVDCDCDCRKPRPGMFARAADALALDLARSAAIGDSARDVEAARRAGVGLCVLVRTGKGAAEDAKLRAAGEEGYEVADDLVAAVKLVLQRRP